MKKIIAFNGSPRKTGNTSAMLKNFINGAKSIGGEPEEINTHDINIDDCTGCMRCNLIKRCSNESDGWKKISEKILESDVVVFATPIYFHHVTASMKKLIDRFRSYNKVQITETGLIHTPWHHWKKEFVLLLCLGSSNASDSRPVVELFEFIRSVLGKENNLHVIIATRLGVVKQIEMNEAELSELYSKMLLPVHLAKEDALKNQETLKKCFDLGKLLAGLIV
jgi:NAD(P)H-dependent FMN reductase